MRAWEAASAGKAKNALVAAERSRKRETERVDIETPMVLLLTVLEHGFGSGVVKT
jgi:hypothetical protein